MNRFLLDTNIISEPLKREPNPVIISRLQQYQEEVSIATVTWHELVFGCYRLPISKRRERIEQYLHEIIEPNIPILSYNVAAAEWFALERARLTANGKPPAYADGQIAATAQVNNLTLITNNVSDYANFQNLRVENWFVV